MAAPFTCKECGAPRQYINQYCPNCESIGPHIPASSAHKDKNNRASASAAKRHAPHINTFEDDPEFTRPRKEKFIKVKEPKPEKIRPPKAVKRVERDEDSEEAVEKKQGSFSFPGRSVLFGTFFVLLGILIVLIVINNGNYSEPANKNNSQASAGTNTSSANASTTNTSSGNASSGNKFGRPGFA